MQEMNSGGKESFRVGLRSAAGMHIS